MSSDEFPTLYNLCINVAVADCITACKFCRKEFRILPNNVLFDFCYKMYLEKRLCLLSVEFSELEVFTRLLKMKHKRAQLLKSFQSLIEHGSKVMDELIFAYSKYHTNLELATTKVIDIGLKLAGFFNEGAWYNKAIEVLNIVEKICKAKEKDENVLKQLLECYHKRVHAEAVFCLFKDADKTFELAQDTVQELKKLGSVPNLAGLYANFSTLYYMKSEYDEAYQWAKKAIALLDESLPTRVIVEVLRQTSKSCVVKRRFNQAGLLIRQAVSLASQLHEIDGHPQYSNTLMDYGFYLLNFDSVKESVKVYEKALSIRKETFDKHNILVAIGYEDLAYALYVNEYSSGSFYPAKENADKSLRIREKILPKDHLLLASARRVKALILEEMALDMREGISHQAQDLLAEAEQLHKSALALSRAAFGENNVQTAKHYGNLGRLYQSMMLYSEAEKMHLRAISIKEQLLGPDDYEVGLSIGHLASLYNYHMRRFRDAEKLYLRSIEINLNLFGNAYSGLEYDYRGLINVYTELQDLNCMIYYNQRMREWMNIRECQKSEPVYPTSSAPLAEIVSKFFSMC